MNDPNTPRNPDDLMDALFAGLQPGEPLADEVERLLNETGGPVPVDDEEARRVAASVAARLRVGTTSHAPRRVVWPLAVAAAVMLGVGATLWLSQSPETSPVAVVPAAQMTPVSAPIDTSGVEISAGSAVTLRDDMVVITDGVVALRRDDPSDRGVHDVRFDSLDVLIEPVGTVYLAGQRGDVAAVWVREGRVRLLHDTQGHLGEVEAGGWALISEHPDGSGIALHRMDDGPFDPVDVGISEEAAASLLADMRWMALPAETRSSIVEPAE